MTLRVQFPTSREPLYSLEGPKASMQTPHDNIKWIQECINEKKTQESREVTQTLQEDTERVRLARAFLAVDPWFLAHHFQDFHIESENKQFEVIRALIEERPSAFCVGFLLFKEFRLQSEEYRVALVKILLDKNPRFVLYHFALFEIHQRQYKEEIATLVQEKAPHIFAEYQDRFLNRASKL